MQLLKPIIKRSTSLCLLLTAALFLANKSYGLEQPDYEVLYRDGKIEYRLYEPYIVAETEVNEPDSYRRATNEGFMRLFRYITGNNTSQTDIAMTAPVQQSRHSDKSGEKIDMTAPVQGEPVEGGIRMAFMLPSKYSLDNAPMPADQRVSLREMPPKLMAVIRWSGRWTERNMQKYEDRLRANIDNAGIGIAGTAEMAVYDPPYTLPFLRRNEVMIEVTDVPPVLSLSGS